ncbi:hypothetical protein [Hwanghaeella sp.]|uniref:hypothetical protein n=1 Tax=Hwanghaeella sp. TaxID=2605943 RepID=UPI003CCB750A
MDGYERLVWSFAAIAVFAIAILLFHRRRATRFGAMTPILVAIAITIVVVMLLYDPF